MKSSLFSNTIYILCTRDIAKKTQKDKNKGKAMGAYNDSNNRILIKCGCEKKNTTKDARIYAEEGAAYWETITACTLRICSSS